MKISRYDPEPLYYQLKTYIKKMVVEELTAGDVIPSERELSAKFKLSRMTVRQAINALVDEGILYREQGKGTFVTNLRITKGGSAEPITSFTEDILNRGMTPSSVVMEFHQEIPTDEVGKVIEDSSVYKLRRVREADKVPLAIETTFLPSSYFIGLESYNFADLSLYNVLREEYGVRFTKLTQSFFVSRVNEIEASHLRLLPGDAALFTNRTLYDVKGVPIEFSKGVYHPDKYRFTMEAKI